MLKYVLYRWLQWVFILRITLHLLHGVAVNVVKLYNSYFQVDFIIISSGDKGYEDFTIAFKVQPDVHILSAICAVFPQKTAGVCP